MSDQLEAFIGNDHQDSYRITPMQEVDLALKECGIGWFHVLLLTSSIIGLIAGILVTNTTPYIIPIAECDLNMSLIQKGLLNAMPYIGMTLVSILVGFLTDTFGRKIFLVSGFCGLFLFAVVGGSSQSYKVLVMAKFFEGVFDRQYGFRQRRSAGDLLAYLTHRWSEAIEGKGEALAVSLDVAKAFDRVWHRALLSKLPSYGLPEKLRAWIASFLEGRSIKVVVDGACSDPKPINAGVPQGCVLSPTLFLLHINDMLQISNIHCYADDSTGDALLAMSFGPNLTMTSEFCYKEIRDRVILFRSSFKAVAQIIVAAMSWGILSHDWNLILFNGYINLHIWNIYLYLMSIWSLLSFVLYLVLPESPKFYITQNKFTEAKHVIFKIYTMNTGKPAETFTYFNLWKNKENEIIDQEPKTKVETFKQQLLTGLNNVKPMFKKPLVSYLVLISAMNFLSLGFYNIIRLWFPQLSTIVEHYSNFNGDNNLCDLLDTYIHNLNTKRVNTTLSEVCVPTRSGDETYINSMILGCVCIIPFVLSGILVNKVGKKNLFIAGGLICIGVTLGIRWANSKFAVVALFSVDVAVLQTLTGLYQASTVELFPTRMKTLAIAVIMTLGRIGTLMGNVAFPILLNMGCVVPFYSLTSVMICVTAMALFLPKS
ncbi:synaptic vesicle glycoprotein 2B [Papilio machaon]|uniref:synaptic vesicle glycoprotein 2B n=1 Tax=Papilio machaon TaxID=76193 RepID=UPI001E6658C8|nr:synaptic vesicle glycoprotein 2B [Papilio machaon]